MTPTLVFSSPIEREIIRMLRASLWISALTKEKSSSLYLSLAMPFSRFILFSSKRPHLLSLLQSNLSGLNLEGEISPATGSLNSWLGVFSSQIFQESSRDKTWRRMFLRDLPSLVAVKITSWCIGNKK
ncbi:hypothetical protein RIF29_41248 [Crotalaria pallida]|uniref:Uncharacterized protein n=1 Tax=Crotalaria pallida TaxID=3830 RepID=A0AAN9E575_CROPI